MKTLTVDVKETANRLIEESDILSNRERFVLRMRFGLGVGIDDSKEHTLQQIADMLGVTKERIRQIEANGLRRIKPKLPTHLPSPC